MIKIDHKTNINSLEKSHNELCKNNKIDVSISKGQTSADFGLVPAIIQFFATWYNKTIESKIIIDLKKEEDLKDFYELDYLFPVIAYCWSRNIEDNNGKDLKPLLKIQNKIKHDKMKIQSEGGGHKVLLSCFDHLSVKNGLLNAFYTDGIFISNEMQFDFAIEKSIKQAITFNRSLAIANFIPNYEDIIAIIYELMKNTDDWARTDEFNKPLSPNTRGLFLKFHRRKRENFSTMFENTNGLKNYFSIQNFVANKQDELYFLELSIYDTGIGFIKRHLTKGETTPESASQIDIIKHCLIRNNTTATGIDKTIKGLGLDRIMKILDDKGFFWLRTGNVSVFRNLRENRYKESAKSDDIELYDWFSNSSKEYTNLCPVQGSVITLVYPLSNVTDA
ncbi:MAG: hypothetical protein WKF85_04770 [Chitinophagaceae bacterium]